MRIQINNKSWYDITDFDSYEEIEDLGEVTGTSAIPDGLDIETHWDEIQEYLGLADEEQAIMMAYYEATNTFDWSEAQEAYVGEYLNDAEFAEAFCEEVEADTLGGLPDYLKFNIDWQGVWDGALRYDYFEQDGLYFRNV